MERWKSACSRGRNWNRFIRGGCSLPPSICCFVALSILCIANSEMDPSSICGIATSGAYARSAKQTTDAQELQALKIADQTLGPISRYHRQIGSLRKLLMGLGSSPPTCISRCAKCTPCKAVRVPIQPGRKAVGLMEYYPEVWRCQCKNKLYKP